MRSIDMKYLGDLGIIADALNDTIYNPDIERLYIHIHELPIVDSETFEVVGWFHYDGDTEKFIFIPAKPGEA